MQRNRLRNRVLQIFLHFAIGFIDRIRFGRERQIHCSLRQSQISLGRSEKIECIFCRQGDGEASGTAIECPIERAELTLTVRDDLELDWPSAWTPAEWITFGFDADLDAAAALALDGMLRLIEREHGLDRKYALAVASVTVDVRVTQLVNGGLGAHAVLAHDAFRQAKIPKA